MIFYYLIIVDTWHVLVRWIKLDGLDPIGESPIEPSMGVVEGSVRGGRATP
jgi:hypothetical protein